MHAGHSRLGAGQRLVLGLLTALLLGVGGLGLATAGARDPVEAARLVRRKTVEVPESALAPVPTGITLKRGQRANIACSGKIWAGVWLTGDNGPEGWSNTSAGSDYPLPGAQVYSAIGRLKDRSFYVGQGTEIGGRGALSLWINDNVHNNGSGAFQCTIKVYSR